MNPISSSSLLHFTKRKSALKGILEKGFRFSYCCEDTLATINMNEAHPEGASFFRPSNNAKAHIAIPMICFCDIPITRAKSHSNIYGKYILGINKDMAQTVYGDSLNPVLYRTSDNIKLALSDLSVIKAGNNIDVSGCHNHLQSINHIIGSTKPYSGNFKNKSNHCFYDEREWRILIPSDYSDDTKWYWNISIEEFQKRKKEINKTLWCSKYAFRALTVEDTDNNENEKILTQFITHIIVAKENNIPEFVKFILNTKQPLFGYSNVSDQTRNILVSKITSFERIEKDY